MKGSCFCKLVQYEIKGLSSVIQHCSCFTCRKIHASPFTTVAAVKVMNFRWLKGEDFISQIESSSGSVGLFCSRCGTHLVKKVDGRDDVVLRIATLDHDPGEVPQEHIWVSGEVPWLCCHPSIPRKKHGAS